MSVTLSHPFRLDGNGAVVVTLEGSERHAAELAGHVLACVTAERPLAPAYGLPDPLGVGIDGVTVAAVVESCEPELSVTAVDVEDTTAAGRVTLAVTVAWASD